MKFAQTVRDLTKKLSDTVNVTQAARADITEVRTRISELQRHVQEASNFSLPRADVIARIREVVARDGDHWIREYGNSLIVGEVALASATVPDAGQVRLPGYGKDLMTWGAMCAGDPARAEAQLEALVARVQYAEGPSQADRPAILDRLTRELQELEADEEGAIDAMNAAGVQIAHRPEVVERREQAARVKEIEERRSVDSRQRQAAIDNRPRTRIVNPDAARRTGGESQYLKTGRV